MAEIYSIKVLEGSTQGLGFMLPDEGEVLIGRHSDCFIRIIDDEISRHQARLIRKGNKWIIMPLSESVFTYVEGHYLKGPHVLRDAEHIVVGTTLMEFQVTPIYEEGEPTPELLERRSRRKTRPRRDRARQGPVS